MEVTLELTSPFPSCATSSWDRASLPCRDFGFGNTIGTREGNHTAIVIGLSMYASSRLSIALSNDEWICLCPTHALDDWQVVKLGARTYYWV